MTLLLQKRFRSAMTMAAWLTTLPVAYGGGTAPIPVKVLVDKADAIVIATIVGGMIAAPVANLNLDVQEVLKGALRVGDLLPVECPLSGEAARYTVSIEKDRGLFFLRATNGRWSILSAASGTVPEIRGTFFVLPTSSMPKAFGNGVQPSLHERVLAEVAGALEDGSGQPKGAVVDFMWEYRSSPSPAMKTLFAQFPASTNAQLRAAGLRASLANPNGQVLAQIEQGLGKQSIGDTALIADEIQYYLTVTDSQVVAQLGRLAVSQASPAPIRKASLTALARVHTKESLPYLAEFLDEPDPELRSLAVGGMAMFANNVPAGEHDPAAGTWQYRTEETLRYSAMDPTMVKNNPSSVTFWKAWWAQNKVGLGH